LDSDDVDLKAKHRGKNVFEVAEFGTYFWEVAGSTTHEGVATESMAAVLDDDRPRQVSTTPLRPRTVALGMAINA
jgi:hypothetical protein